ncbi:MAG: hypothetical protein V4596_04475 [Bdellovibrionota bacterium]
MDDNLFEKIVKSTGLPEELVTQDFLKKISDKGFEKSTLTLDQIRDVLADYLQDVILQVREEYK